MAEKKKEQDFLTEVKSFDESHSPKQNTEEKLSDEEPKISPEELAEQMLENRQKILEFRAIYRKIFYSCSELTELQAREKITREDFQPIISQIKSKIYEVLNSFSQQEKESYIQVYLENIWNQVFFLYVQSSSKTQKISPTDDELIAVINPNKDELITFILYWINYPMFKKDWIVESDEIELNERFWRIADSVLFSNDKIFSLNYCKLFFEGLREPILMDNAPLCSIKTLGTLVAIDLGDNGKLKESREEDGYLLVINPIVLIWEASENEIAQSALEEVWVEKTITDAPYSHSFKTQSIWLLGRLEIGEERKYKLNLLEEVEQEIAISLLVESSWFLSIASINELTEFSENNSTLLEKKWRKLNPKKLLSILGDQNNKTLERLENIEEQLSEKWTQSLSFYQKKILNLKPELSNKINSLENWINIVTDLFYDKRLSEQEIFDLDENSGIKTEKGEFFSKQELMFSLPIVKEKVRKDMALNQISFVEDIIAKAQSNILKLYDKEIDKLKGLNKQLAAKKNSKKKKKKKWSDL